MNKVILIGNLTRDPEVTESASGVSICRFAIAVSRDYATNGNRETDYFNITTFNKTAENCGKYLKKGNKVAVYGAIQNSSYEDKDGIKRTSTSIVANEVEFLTPKSASGEDMDAPVVSAKRERPVLEEMDDNQLPF